MTAPLPPDDTDALILRYLDGQISRDGFARLSELLHEDPASLDRFVELSRLDRSIRDALDQGHTLASVQQARLVSESTGESFEDLLTQLATGSENAQTVVLQDPTKKRQSSPNKTNNEPVSARELLLLVGYLTAKGLRTKAGVIGSIAAVLLLGLILVLVFVGPGDPSGSPEIVDNTPGKPEIETARIVATVIDSVDTSWQGVEPSVGGSLHNGQPITLTRGYATLRFRNQAEVVLEAPCEIVPLSESAIRLTRGRMVALCEAEPSKGFTVNTPNARIVDIGTEFGVEVDEQGGTLAHVFQGEVRINSTQDLGTEGLRIVTNQAVSVEPDGTTKVVDAAPQRFARGVPQTRYQAAVLASRPMCYWRGPVEEETRLVLDNGWLGAHGQASESLQHNPLGYTAEDASGSLGYSADEPASSVTVPYRDEFAFEDGYSISAWCWIEPGHQDVMRILSTRVEGGGIGLGVIGRGDKATGGLPASAPILTVFGESDVVAMSAMAEGQWSHLAVTVSRDGVARVYINGSEVPTRTIPHTRDPRQSEDSDTQPLMIGRNPFTGQGVQAWQGRLDEIAIFDRVLSDNEIQAHLSTTTQAP